MALTYEEYGLIGDFSVLFSGGLDSSAVPLIVGGRCSGDIHLLTFEHRFGSFFNEWSRRQVEPLRRALGPRVYHQLVDHSDTWSAISASRMVRDAWRYRGHFVCCLGCHCAMMTEIIAYSVERNVTNTFICSSVGGEYSVMSMPITRVKKQAFYARFGIRYNAPLLDLGIRKEEERVMVRESGLRTGWGARRSTNGNQPICVLGFHHSLDIVADVHTTYDPAQVARFIEEKSPIMERLIRERLALRGFDPDALIERNLARYRREQDAIDALRRERGMQLPQDR